MGTAERCLSSKGRQIVELQAEAQAGEYCLIVSTWIGDRIAPNHIDFPSPFSRIPKRNRALAICHDGRTMRCLRTEALKDNAGAAQGFAVKPDSDAEWFVGLE